MKSYILTKSRLTINHYANFIFISLLFSFLFTFCSSTKETEKESKADDEIYIFDEVPPEDSYTFEKPINDINFFYVIQIGAFSTRERAELFVEKSRKELNRESSITYNDEVDLYVVRLDEMFNSKIDAERVRANLWQLEDYNDAWIIPIRQRKE